MIAVLCYRICKTLLGYRYDDRCGVCLFVCFSLTQCGVQGSLVGIVGRVGSGKSALLSAIAAELHRATGHVIIGADVLDQGFGFVTQDAWTQHATLRDNVLFGRYFDRRKYDAVIGACALVEDLKVG